MHSRYCDYRWLAILGHLSGTELLLVLPTGNHMRVTVYSCFRNYFECYFIIHEIVKHGTTL